MADRTSTGGTATGRAAASPAPRTSSPRPPDRVSSTRGRPASAPTGWATSLLVWLTLAASLASLSSLFQGAGWWFAGAGVAAVVLGASLGARALGAGPVLGWLAGLVSGLLVTSALVSGGTAVLGVVPTAATLQRLRDLGDQATTTIVEGTAPVEVQDGLLAVLVAAVLGVAVVSDLVSTVGRLPGLTGAFPAVVLAVPSFVPGTTVRWPWVVLAVLCWIALLAVSTGRRPTRATAVGGVAAVGVAALLTAVVPFGGVSPLTGVGTGTGLATGVNPVVDLGDDLRRGAPESALSQRIGSRVRGIRPPSDIGVGGPDRGSAGNRQHDLACISTDRLTCTRDATGALRHRFGGSNPAVVLVSKSGHESRGARRAAAADDDGHGGLYGLGKRWCVHELVVVARETVGLADRGGPEPGDDLELLLEHPEPLGRERDAVSPVLGLEPPRAEPQLDAAVRHLVDLCHLNCENRRHAMGCRRDESAQANGARLAGKSPQRRPRIGGSWQSAVPRIHRHVVVGSEESVKPELLRCSREPKLIRVGCAVLRFGEDPEVHTPSLLSPRMDARTRESGEPG